MNQSRKLLIRANISGEPRPHGTPHETAPITVPPWTRGPPESPMHMPSLTGDDVQTVVSKMRSAWVAERRDWQTALVMTSTSSHWSSAAAPPGWLVCPWLIDENYVSHNFDFSQQKVLTHPDALARPPVTKIDPNAIGATAPVNEMGFSVLTIETSFRMVAEL